MKRWLAGALLGAGAAGLLGAWWGSQAAATPTAVAPAAQPSRSPIKVPAAPAIATAAPPSATPTAAKPLPADEAAPPTLNVQEAQMLIQLMAEQGDPRRPPLGQLKPRQPASAAQLADPAQYQAFEDQHSRDLIMAYASGVQQIPAIRERIEQAAQSGERNANEIDEARAALEQLEMLQSKLQRERPELLPGGETSGAQAANSVAK